MNKAELDALTKHESTAEEFDAIERLYLAAPDMTKADAANLWRRWFLDAARKREAEEKRPADGGELVDALRNDLQHHPCAGRTRRIRIRTRLYRFKGGYGRNENEFHCDEVLAVNVATGEDRTRNVGNFWPRYGSCILDPEYRAEFE